MEATAYRRPGGAFLRSSDGQAAPQAIVEETDDKIEQIFRHLEASNKLDKSCGHLFEEHFEAWMKNEKCNESEEIKRWRRLYFWCMMSDEEKDNACEDLFELSAKFWSNFEWHDPPTDLSFVNGYQSLVNEMEKFVRASGVQILTEHPVTSIRWKDKVEVLTKNGRRFDCDHVLVTVPLGYLKLHHKTLFDPPLPRPNVTAIEGLKHGVVNRLVMVFDGPLADVPLGGGFNILWEDDWRGETNWFKNYNVFTPLFQQPNVMISWSNGNPARFASGLSKQQVKDTIQTKILDGIVAKYEARNGLKPLPKLKDVFVSKWEQNQYQLGSYSYMDVKGQKMGLNMSDLSQPLRDKQGTAKVLFSGEACSDNHYGTVHGAFETAVREIDRVLSLL